MRGYRLPGWLLPLLMGIGWSCGSPPQQAPPVEDITTPPPVAPADTPHAGVFQSLDGVWEGEFRIYRIPQQPPSPVRPRLGEDALPDTLPLQLTQIIRVRQEYTSQSPYFQRVHIRDQYVTETGDTVTMLSRGVNKVQNGQLWCVVVKPEETVVHRGTLLGARTIIWQRDNRDHSPEEGLKIEYFRETVRDSLYTIVGWGYYDGDDPHRAPRWWFSGRYHRIR